MQHEVHPYGWSYHFLTYAECIVDYVYFPTYSEFCNPIVVQLLDKNVDARAAAVLTLKFWLRKVKRHTYNSNIFLGIYIDPAFRDLLMTAFTPASRI